jgi:superfamily II DNA or RNA helicase
MTETVRLRDELWRVESHTRADAQSLYRLRSLETGETITVLSPPDLVQPLPSGPPGFDRRAVSPFGVWQSRHDLIRLTGTRDELATFSAGRVQLEPYQLVPVRKLLQGPSRSLLIADDVGLGKTVEAGLCMLELIARGVGKRILLVVPPGLIDQWLAEMRLKFGLDFQPIADSASLDSAQTALAEGISPWSFHDRIITSVEYLKRPEVYWPALRRGWDVVVVDEAHYLSESGSPANPYATRRTRLGIELRKATRSLILLTATPHNGYRHSFRSLIELVEPTDAAFSGDVALVQRRVGRSMVRRLKQQIARTAPDGTRVPAFKPRAPVARIDVHCGTLEEREIFTMVSAYCARTADSAEQGRERDLVSFAMQIVKKRMLSSRAALLNTVEHRLEALRSDADDDLPTRSELRELESDLPLPEDQADRLARRVLRGAVPRDARRRNSERRRLHALKRALQRITDRPDPKIERLIAELRERTANSEKVIVFTEYRDTLDAIRMALDATAFTGRYVELTGGLSQRQRRQRIEAFAAPDCSVLLATDAASEGLNLQEHCHRLLHVELPWNPNRLEQRNGRIDRHGQRRTPEIGYLFYADSPEDRVLDRLVTRIGQMHADRVSTPDIIGIVETANIGDRLASIADDASAEREAESLVRIFEDQRNAFARDVAPLLAGASNAGEDDTSADPILDDDIEFEAVMLRTLGAAARAIGEGAYRIRLPLALQGAGVKPEYPAATFRRSVALESAFVSAEFIHRLHPLARAAAALARDDLTLAADPSLPSALAVRRLRGIETPAIVFTFLDRTPDHDGELLTIGFDIGGSPLAAAHLSAAMADDREPGEATWAECERIFGASFAELQAKSATAIFDSLRARRERELAVRSERARALREEAEAYRADRLRELERDEAEERAGHAQQTELFRELHTNWAARRAAVATNADARLRAIAEWESLPEPQPPQPLGALLILPATA